MPTPRHIRRRRALLALLGPAALQRESCAGLDEEDWLEIDLLAGQHRLHPHLHARILRGELAVDVPAPMREAWAMFHREWALVMLAQRRDLLAAAQLLHDAGIAPIALKGSWLAWHAYPAAAERPTRDVDLLVETGELLPTYHLLREAGYTLDPEAEEPVEAALASMKHLPPIMSPHGSWIELHHHLWEPDGAMEWFVPETSEARFRARAVAAGDGETLRYLARQDLLAHLVIHAVYSHRLDAGPLLLADIDYLLAAGPVDWDAFWQAAENGGWRRGAAIVLALADRWRCPGLLAASACPEPVPAELLDDAGDLLVQRLDQRKGAGLVTGLRESWRDGGVMGLAGRARARLAGERRPAGAGPDAQDGGEDYYAWLKRRAGETFGQLRSGEALANARRSAELGAWLGARSEKRRGLPPDR